MIKIKKDKNNNSVYHIFHKDHWWERWKEYDYSERAHLVTVEWILSRLTLLFDASKEIKISAKH